MRDLSSQTRDRTWASGSGSMESFNYWTAREVPCIVNLDIKFFLSHDAFILIFDSGF